VLGKLTRTVVRELRELRDALNAATSFTAR
jgi:hypothetical protein